jgi:HD-GYP domain-containing protein (c-di-GMP phosphodiesterase class II)
LYVVDAYVRLRSPRPGRPDAGPARALRRIVRGNGRAIDGSVARALLRVLSLFPIGSRVQLSDASLARVVRANADDFTCPVVQLLPESDGAETPHAPLIDLAYSDLRVVRSLSD